MCDCLLVLRPWVSVQTTVGPRQLANPFQCALAIASASLGFCTKDRQSMTTRKTLPTRTYLLVLRPWVTVRTRLGAEQLKSFPKCACLLVVSLGFCTNDGRSTTTHNSLIFFDVRLPFGSASPSVSIGKQQSVSNKKAQASTVFLYDFLQRWSVSVHPQVMP